MFCRNCGERYMAEDAAWCAKCGVQRGLGDNFCPNCGQPTPLGAKACMYCGIALSVPAYRPEGGKSKLAAGLLGIFLGTFGVHNFYLGYTGKAVAQLVITLATCGIGSFISAIWGFVEGILILCGSIRKDGKGRFLND